MRIRDMQGMTSWSVVEELDPLLFSPTSAEGKVSSVAPSADTRPRSLCSFFRS